LTANKQIISNQNYFSEENSGENWWFRDHILVKWLTNIFAPESCPWLSWLS
jgi:hypothetical protein